MPIAPFQVTLSGTTQISATSIPNKNGIMIKALSTNTGPLFWGYSGVTTGTGFELAAGEGYLVTPADASDANLLYVVGTDGDKVSVKPVG